ncbi:MAG: FtsX-like permease family protein [Candidatus Riflebacteria bacterium]|nr:FtsX-like permease family protein [Candidatus Riflebacteria bacterium]
MKVSSLIKGSLASFRMNLFRTFLALLGIIFGVSSVIAMITIGEGAQRRILDNINALGADLVHIQEGNLERGQLSQFINDSQGLSLRDVRALRAVLPMAGRDLAYFAKLKVKVTSLPVQAGELNVFGVSGRFLPMNQLRLSAGRSFHPDDFRVFAPVAIVSRDLAEQAWETPEAGLGKVFRLEERYFRVVGVFERRTLAGAAREAGREGRPGGSRGGRGGGRRGRGMPRDFGIYERSVLLPYATARETLAAERVYSPLDKILLQCRSLDETSRMKEAADRVLAVTHNGVRDYRTFSPLELLEQQQSTQEIFNIVLLSIASISLLVGGIGIMNIMLANVLERRVEIGIRRALGAKRRHIVFQFLFESVTICLIGGGLGILLGLGIGLCIMQFTKIPVAFTLKPILISFGISFSVGVFFGIMPAREAAALNPVEALHDE